MSQKVIVNNSDYDSYCMKMPFQLFKLPFVHSHIEQYILSEIEKIHPFFGMHCKVDFRIIIQRMKISLLVVVMDTIILQKYQTAEKNKSLYIQHNIEKKLQTIQVFKNSVSHKQKKIFFLGALVILSFLLGTFYFAVLSPSLIQKNNQNHTDTVLIGKDENIPVTALFQQVKKWLQQGALITQFSYEEQHSLVNNKTHILIKASLTGLHPESIFNFSQGETGFEQMRGLETTLQISPIVFEKNIPKLSLSFSHVVTYSTPKIESNGMSEGNYIRDLVLSHAGSIREENWENKSLSFFLPLAQWASFCDLFFEYLQKSNQAIGTLSLVHNNNSSIVNAYISVKHGIQSAELLVIKNMFENHNIKVIPSFSNGISSSERKIGNVKKNDGSEVIFYLTEEGKITSKEVN